MKKEYDSVRNISFYQSWSMPPSYQRPYVSAYISVRDKDNLLIRFNYHDSSWLYVSSVDVVVDNKDRYHKNVMPSRNVVRPYGGIIECADYKATDEDIEMLWKIVNSNSALIRFNGSSYYDDNPVYDEDKISIKNVLEAYDALEEFDYLFK